MGVPGEGYGQGLSRGRAFQLALQARERGDHPLQFLRLPAQSFYRPIVVKDRQRAVRVLDQRQRAGGAPQLDVEEHAPDLTALHVVTCSSPEMPWMMIPRLTTN